MKVGGNILLTIVIVIASMVLAFLLDMSGFKYGNTIGIALAVAGIAKVWGLKKSKSDKKDNIEEQEHKVEIPIEPEMILVQGGTFTMGCTSEQGDDCEDDEKPARQVTISDFYIGKYEITQAQWKAVMGYNLSHFRGDNLPVEMVSWNEVREFITKLNGMTGHRYRLPTEAEWEYAARGGNKSNGYKYSGSNTIDSVAWYKDNSGGQTRPVGAKQANELGIYDMSGNVYEYCSDWYVNYNSNAQTNPQGPSTGSSRVFRGGSWNRNAKNARVSYRGNGNPDEGYGNLGFRLALSLK